MSQYFSNDKLSVYSKHMTLQALLNTCENKMMFKMTGKRLNLLLPEVFVYYSLKLVQYLLTITTCKYSWSIRTLNRSNTRSLSLISYVYCIFPTAL